MSASSAALASAASNEDFAVDPDGLQEFSVVFTDRSLNSMSKRFQQVMRDVHDALCEVYSAHTMAVVPGGGTFAMEAVARQFAGDRKALVVRNGWFSYRWTQIFEAGSIPSSHIVIKARQVGNGGPQVPFTPPPVEEVVAQIKAEKPDVVFAPHVETSAGLILPDDYIRTIGEAVHEVGGLMVLDCIASGTVWVDMKACNVDVLISAPQKGWSSSPSSGLVMLSERARARADETASSSFACDLKKWLQIMDAYRGGGHAYHATMPTDALRGFAATIAETMHYGLDRVRDEQWALGRKVRGLLAERGFKSVAAPGFEAPGVVVSYTDDPDIQNGSKFARAGVQIAAGVPLQVDEPADFRTFRIGLFGHDKLHNPDATVTRLQAALDAI
ncbi:MAG: aminotransferase class V-fold PLP-dependent enzyme [Pseudomonadota bacterium]